MGELTSSEELIPWSRIRNIAPMNLLAVAVISMLHIFSDETGSSEHGGLTYHAYYAPGEEDQRHRLNPKHHLHLAAQKKPRP